MPTLTPLTIPSYRTLPAPAKRVLKAYRAAPLAKLERLGKRRLSKIDGRVTYAFPGSTTAVAHLLAKWRDLMGGPGWYAIVREYAYKATRETCAAGTHATTGPGWKPWVQAADLELQARLILAILDAAGIAVDDDVREWVMAPWLAIKLEA